MILPEMCEAHNISERTSYTGLSLSPCSSLPGSSYQRPRVRLRETIPNEILNIVRSFPRAHGRAVRCYDTSRRRGDSAAQRRFDAAGRGRETRNRTGGGRSPTRAAGQERLRGFICAQKNRLHRHRHVENEDENQRKGGPSHGRRLSSNYSFLFSSSPRPRTNNNPYGWSGYPRRWHHRRQGSAPYLSTPEFIKTKSGLNLNFEQFGNRDVNHEAMP